ncbi:MAG TPA: ABC transporter ATP-binding protein [Xanthobacteraceae bacterium]|nr:ABC transporter ATP-binding protein [Xanthobacteraceae bacterium]
MIAQMTAGARVGAHPHADAAAPALAVDEIVAGFGPLTVLHGISLTLAADEVVVVLGANGAGKTTLLRTIAGLIAPRSGGIRLFGESLVGRPPHRIARAGIGHVPSGRELFPRLSVADHLELGGRLSTPERRDTLRAQVLAMFPPLATRLQRRAGTLSGGEQQMVAIARALMTDPRVLLLDEPSTGLAPKVVAAVFATFPLLRRNGVSTLLVEQSMTLGLSAADRAYVIDQGRIALSGTATELAGDPRVVAAYLGR